MLDPASLVGKTINDFRLEEFVARGAVGMVFRAEDLVLNRTVALKLISKREEFPEAAEVLKRFLQEAKAAGGLSHPNIVTIHSYGETEEFQYICMEYLEGKTLAAILKEEKKLSLHRALPLFEQILMAIEASYRAGIVHRDIKPMNLMIMGSGRLKVMDFGIAKVPSVSLTAEGTILGTPFYMSPEQITGKIVDIRSDIFSIGAVLYQSLTGARLFEAQSGTALVYLIVNVDPTPPKVINSELPDEICVVLMKAMAKDPAQRYQTPSAMLEDLAEVERVLLPDSSRVGLLGKTERKRHKGPPDPAGDEPASPRTEEWTPDFLREERPPADVPAVAAVPVPEAVPEPGGKEPKRPRKRIFRKTIMLPLIGFLLALAGAYWFWRAEFNRYRFDPALLFQWGRSPAPATQVRPPSPPVPARLPAEGRYVASGTNPDGTRYGGVAFLSRSGNRFFITWSIGNQAFSGTGVLSGGTLVVSSNRSGTNINYVIRSNGTLQGVFANGRGTETLVPSP